MTPNTTTATNGQTPATERNKPARIRKPAKRKAAAVSRRATNRPAKRSSATGSYSATASRLLSKGKQALGGAYGWAADGAGRALPKAARYVPDQRTLPNLLEERPLVLGAIGLGLGAMIGMMLPSRLMAGRPLTRSPARRPGRKG